MIEDIKDFSLEKRIWTHDDFELMGWHDSNIYALSIAKTEDAWATDLLLDLDYIFKWVNPTPPDHAFTFWVAPCTLIFNQCFDVHIDFKTDGGFLDSMEVDRLWLKSKVEQEKNKFVYDWMIELQQGQIGLKSYGFEQVVKQRPQHVKRQVLSLDERGGINFERKSY